MKAKQILRMGVVAALAIATTEVNESAAHAGFYGGLACGTSIMLAKQHYKAPTSAEVKTAIEKIGAKTQKLNKMFITPTILIGYRYAATDSFLLGVTIRAAKPIGKKTVKWRGKYFGSDTGNDHDQYVGAGATFGGDTLTLRQTYVITGAITLGYAPTPDWLLEVLAGVDLAHYKYTYNYVNAAKSTETSITSAMTYKTETSKKLKIAPTVGLSCSYKITENISAFVNAMMTFRQKPQIPAHLAQNSTDKTLSSAGGNAGQLKVTTYKASIGITYTFC
ncbi:MAG: hypothetical protein LBF56_01210 [Holosporales bacterium]|jgi:hypothetical protein|nr:hypothetical protein [Holosporales bacterium]